MARSRRLGKVEPVDLVIGLVAILALPVIGYVVTGLIKPEDPLPEVDEQRVPAPERTEVQERFSYVRALQQNAVGLLQRAESADEKRQLTELRWANQAFHAARKELTNLRHIITASDSEDTFRSDLDALKTIETSISVSLARIQKLDKLDLIGG
ncbi:MAG: hypothetical protein AAF488_13240 [Planctomycetota bacterium]